jgi:hypothetical protein
MSRKIIFICGRENLSEDGIFQAKLVSYLQSLPLTILDEAEMPALEEDDVTPIKDQALFSKILNKYLGILSSFWQVPNRFRTLFKCNQSQANIEYRMGRLRQSFQHFDWENLDVYLVGRSAGAIVASRIAMEFPVKAVIALGYPFVHPDYGKQSYRVKHLAQMNRSMYIFQGIRDGYGNPKKIASISMSRNVQIMPLDTDHAFVLEGDSWEQFTSQLSTILA